MTAPSGKADAVDGTSAIMFQIASTVCSIKLSIKQFKAMQHVEKQSLLLTWTSQMAVVASKLAVAR